MMRRAPAFTLTVVLTLALGIGANAAIFSAINGVLLKPLPYPAADRLVMLWERNPQRGVEQEAVTPPNYADWKEQSRVFEQIVYWNGVEPVNLVTRDGVEKVRRAYVESSFFSVLRIAPLLGRTFLSGEDQYTGGLDRARARHLLHGLRHRVTNSTRARARFHTPIQTLLRRASRCHALKILRRGALGQ